MVRPPGWIVLTQVPTTHLLWKDVTPDLLIQRVMEKISALEEYELKKREERQRELASTAPRGLLLLTNPFREADGVDILRRCRAHFSQKLIEIQSATEVRTSSIEEKEVEVQSYNAHRTPVRPPARPLPAIPTSTERSVSKTRRQDEENIPPNRAPIGPRAQRSILPPRRTVGLAGGTSPGSGCITVEPVVANDTEQVYAAMGYSGGLQENPFQSGANVALTGKRAMVKNQELSGE